MSVFQDQDQTVTCKGCNSDFIFTLDESKIYQEKGYQNVPLRCEDCRKEKRDEVNSRRSGGDFRKRGYHTPLPEPTNVVKDNETIHHNGQIVYILNISHSQALKVRNPIAVLVLLLILYVLKMKRVESLQIELFQLLSLLELEQQNLMIMVTRHIELLVHLAIQLLLVLNQRLRGK